MNDINQRYRFCGLALDFLRRHGRPPRKTCVQWERIFNAFHQEYELNVIQAIDELLSEYPTELGLKQETERLRKAIGEPQNIFVEVIEMRDL